MIAITTNHDFKNNRIVVHCDYGLFRFPLKPGVSLDEARHFAVNEINRMFYKNNTFNPKMVVGYPNKRDKKIHIIELC